MYAKTLNGLTFSTREAYEKASSLIEGFESKEGDYYVQDETLLRYGVALKSGFSLATSLSAS